MHHFFVTPQQISGDKIRIEGGDVNHMKNVLRMKLHEKAEISDGELKTEARFDNPCGIAYDEETQTFYIADRENHSIRTISIE